MWAIPPRTAARPKAPERIVHKLSMLSAQLRTPSSRTPQVAKKPGRWKTTRPTPIDGISLELFLNNYLNLRHIFRIPAVRPMDTVSGGGGGDT